GRIRSPLPLLLLLLPWGSNGLADRDRGGTPQGTRSRQIPRSLPSPQAYDERSRSASLVAARAIPTCDSERYVSPGAMFSRPSVTGSLSLTAWPRKHGTPTHLVPLGQE